jgi:phosphoglycerol transferase MdoB-like AlkP superfamily enzyme
LVTVTVRVHALIRPVAFAALVVISASACRRVPPPPYDYQFAIQIASPRLLETSSEMTVPLTLVNRGRLAWDPQRVHLSYHWLWLIPRELPSRSRWDVPYHNGIRTKLGTRVSPGGRTALQGRLQAPSWPGLYWLQWDMVEEGVAWFAQAAPRQPRTLVLVLPPIAWVLAPVPLLVALLGIAASRRPTAGFPAIADAAWCSAALFCKPLLLIHEALLEPTAVAYWLAAVAALLPSALGLLLLPRRVRSWTLVAIGILGSTIVLSDVLYVRFFGDILSAPAVLAVGQTGHVWGSVRSLVSPVLLWMVIDWPFAIWVAARIAASPVATPTLRHRLTSSGIAIGALAAAGVLVSAPRVLRSVPLGQTFRDRAVAEQLGVFGFHVYDLWNYSRGTWFRPTATEAEAQDAVDWFAERMPLRAGPGSPVFGAGRGRSVIVVQVESLQDFVVDLRANGDDVMPFLKAWTRQAVRFTNVTDQTSQGRTSDAEFTAMTSLLPLEHGAVAFRYPGNHYTALPRVLSENGYSTLSAVPFEPGFWNRGVMHPSYGFQRSLFEPDFQVSDQIGWGLNDHKFLEQMLPRLADQPRPFLAWLITLSLHHPYDDFPERHKTLRLGALDHTSFGNYLHAMRFFDEGLRAFVSGLNSRGLLDDTVVVVYGDHDAGFVRDPAIARAIGIREDDVAWARNDRVPLFIRIPAGSDEPAWRGSMTIAAGQTDVAPTLLAILGIDAARLPYVGRNLFNSAIDVPVLRPYGEWLDDHRLFLAHGSVMVCYDADGLAAAPAPCDAADVQARRERDISHRVVTTDLQTQIRESLAEQ